MTWDETFRPWLPGLVIGWGLVVFGLSLRLVGGWLCIQWLVRHRTRPAPECWVEVLDRLERRLGMRGAVRLVESARVHVPMAVGWLRPAILLPVTAVTGLSSDQLEAILAHELAHIRRHDYLVNLIQNVLETLLFYHPAVWWISGRIRVEREHCCDDQAVAVCGDRVLYAKALTALEEQGGSTWRLAASARDGSLLARVRRLLGVPAPAEQPAGGLAGTLAMAAVVLFGIISFLAPTTNRVNAAVEDAEAIVGSVVTTDARPVAEADVWLVAHDLSTNKAIILSKARTDGDGRFRLVAIDPRYPTKHLNRRAIWVYKTGFSLATIVAHDNHTLLAFDPGQPVSLTLSKPATASFRVRDPQDKPVSGAEVTLRGIDGGFTTAPEELAARFMVQTDREGRATLNGVSLDRINGIRVVTPSFGIQDFHAPNGLKADAALRLRAAVPVEGRVTADDPAATRNRTVHFSVAPAREFDTTKLLPSGEALVVTDDQGRFRIPALAIGSAYALVLMPEDSWYRAPRIVDQEISQGGRVDLTIPLKRMVRVRGAIREKGTARPVAGLGIMFGSRDVSELLPMAITDAEGRYAAIAPPGEHSYFYLSDSNGYLTPLRGYLGPAGGNQVAIGPTDGQTLPVIELDRGVTLRGSIVDESGQPVRGAKVEGKWTQLGEPFKAANGETGRFASNHTVTATSNDLGEFLLQGIHPGANMLLEASLENARTDRPQPAAAGADTPVKLVISGANTVALIGHVVDSAGKPVAGALVQVRSRPLKDDGHPDPNPIPFDGGEVRTGRDGRFRTPRELKRGYGYRAEVKPEDSSLMPDHTPWLAFKADTRPFFPKVVLRRLRTVHGRVIDSTGKPVAGASVRQAGDGPAWTETLTGDDGRFALPGVLAEPAFVFVAKPGYRFQGRAIGADDTTVEVALARNDDPLPQPLATLPSPLDRAAERVILHKVFDAYIERTIKDGTANARYDVLRVLTELDPGRAIELLGDERLDAWQPDSFRLDLAKHLIREDYEEAHDLIAAIKDTNVRSHAYSEASVALPESERSRKLALLNESLVAGRAVADPAERVLRLADIGERFFDLGQTEEATRLFRDGQAIAAKLPTQGTTAWARGKLAEEMAPIDIPAALGLLKGVEEEREYGQYLGHIAHELAGRNPAEAERILMMSPDAWPNFRDNYTQRVCYRMAGVDLERARKLASGMKDYRHKARALGAMALMLVKARQDQAAPSRLLDAAFAMLDEAVASHQDDWNGLGMACTAAAGLLPIIEQVDARRTPRVPLANPGATAADPRPEWSRRHLGSGRDPGGRHGRTLRPGNRPPGVPQLRRPGPGRPDRPRGMGVDVPGRFALRGGGRRRPGAGRRDDRDPPRRSRLSDGSRPQGHRAVGRCPDPDAPGRRSLARRGVVLAPPLAHRLGRLLKSSSVGSLRRARIWGFRIPDSRFPILESFPILNRESRILNPS